MHLHVIHASLVPRSPNTKPHLDQFSFFAQLTAEWPYTLQWVAPFPPQNCAFRGGFGPHLIHCSLGPPKSSTQSASRSVQMFLQGSLLWQTDRPADCNNRPRLRLYVRNTAMRPNNNNNNYYYYQTKHYLDHTPKLPNFTTSGDTDHRVTDLILYMHMVRIMYRLFRHDRWHLSIWLTSQVRIS